MISNVRLGATMTPTKRPTGPMSRSVAGRTTSVRRSVSASAFSDMIGVGRIDGARRYLPWHGRILPTRFYRVGRRFLCGGRSEPCLPRRAAAAECFLLRWVPRLDTAQDVDLGSRFRCRPHVDAESVPPACRSPSALTPCELQRAGGRPDKTAELGCGPVSIPETVGVSRRAT